MFPMHCSSHSYRERWGGHEEWLWTHELMCHPMLAVTACQAGTKESLLNHSSFLGHPMAGEVRTQSHHPATWSPGPREGRNPAVFFTWPQLGGKDCSVVWVDIKGWMTLLDSWMCVPAACSVHPAECLIAEINICFTFLCSLLQHALRFPWPRKRCYQSNLVFHRTET